MLGLACANSADALLAASFGAFNQPGRVWRLPKIAKAHLSPFLFPSRLELAHFNRNFQAGCDPIIFSKTGGEFTAFEQVAV